MTSSFKHTSHSTFMLLHIHHWNCYVYSLTYIDVDQYLSIQFFKECFDVATVVIYFGILFFVCVM